MRRARARPAPPTQGPAVGQAGERAVRGQLLPRAIGAAFQLDDTRLDTARPDDELPGQPDEVHGRELGAGALVAVVVQNLDARVAQLGV